jgi:hypothetical protein
VRAGDAPPSFDGGVFTRTIGSPRMSMYVPPPGLGSSGNGAAAPLGAACSAAVDPAEAAGGSVNAPVTGSLYARIATMCGSHALAGAPDEESPVWQVADCGGPAAPALGSCAQRVHQHAAPTRTMPGPKRNASAARFMQRRQRFKKRADSGRPPWWRQRRENLELSVPASACVYPEIGLV